MMCRDVLEIEYDIASGRTNILSEERPTPDAVATALVDAIVAAFTFCQSRRRLKFSVYNGKAECGIYPECGRLEEVYVTAEHFVKWDADGFSEPELLHAATRLGKELYELVCKCAECCAVAEASIGAGKPREN